jgi:BirA family transcriptional regulator, biotin operon repressor / biotin---[acetyl-CoA-carboxylase] ligase
MKELILQSLRQERQISGEELGRKLNISRTAVWKHINELRSQGYQINSSPRVGYSLVKSTELLLPEEIQLDLNTQIMGKQVEHYNEVSSTQDIAAEMARSGTAEGTIIIAEMQKTGRGRRGRRWVSPPGGGIYFSLILRPNLKPFQAMQIPLIAGVAVTKAIKATVPLQPEIKWPNDIIICHKKVGGILTEMSSEIDVINHIVLGIGLNVNIPGSLLAEQTAGIATSLIHEYGEKVSRVKLIQCFLYEFESIYRKYLASGFKAIREEWMANSHTMGARVRVNDRGREFEGKAFDLDNDGFLWVRRDSGDVSRIVSGDVSFCN